MMTVTESSHSHTVLMDRDVNDYRHRWVHIPWAPLYESRTLASRIKASLDYAGRSWGSQMGTPAWHIRCIIDSLPTNYYGAPH